MPLTALNSTAVARAPSDYSKGFVRGKSSYFPFRPGGLGDLGLDKVGEKGDGLEALGEGLENAFDRRAGELVLHGTAGTLEGRKADAGVRLQEGSARSRLASRAGSTLATPRRTAGLRPRRKRSRSRRSTARCSSRRTRARSVRCS